MYTRFSKRSWLEIDIGQLRDNLRIYGSALAKGTGIMAVVKADAYGHGFERIAQELERFGIKEFAVSNVIEAIRLRELGIRGSILVLGYTPIEDIPLLLEYGITQTLISYEYAVEILKKGFGKIKCHIAIDSGMNRIGLDADRPELAETQIRELAERFEVEGLFTHLCVADSEREDDVEFTNLQLSKFFDIVRRVSDLGIRNVHTMNSAGGMFYTDKNRGSVRLGIVMYGLRPDYSNELPDGIKPILSWKSVVSMVKKVDAGEYIGYGRNYRAESDRLIATIPTGYADGYRRDLSNKGYVLIKGKRAYIVGNVCMDQMMVDVTDIDGVSIGDEAVLIGHSGEETVTADDIAKMIGTIGYEIICNVSPRVCRTYI